MTSLRKFHLIGATAAITTVFAVSKTQATPLYWAGSTGTVEAPSDGTWSNAEPGFMWSDTGSGAGDVAWIDNGTSLATFDGDDLPHAVLVDSDLNLSGAGGGIVFNNSGFTLSATTPHIITSPLPTVAGSKIDTIGNNVTIQTKFSASIIAAGTTAGGKLIIDTGGALKETCTSAKLVVIGGTGSELQVNSNGLFTSSANNIVVGSGVGSSATLTLDGGTASITRTNSPVGFVAGSTGGTGVITVNSGTLSVAAANAPVTLGDSASSTATLNMNGGTVLAGAISGTTGATSVLNFNGGTFKVNATTTAASIGNLGHAFVLAGGAVVDTSGATATITQNLEHGGAGIDGGLTKIGTGTLVLSGTNTYTGTTVVNAGTVQLGTGGSLLSTSALSLNTGTFDMNGASSVALGNFSLLGSSAINFGAGNNALSFLTTDGTWTGTLTLTGLDSGDTLRIGTSQILTGTQLAEISAAGFAVTGQDSNGFVQFAAVPEPGTMALLIAGGIFAFQFTRIRRRV